MTILLIDDDKNGLAVRAELLKITGYTVLVAYDGEEGLGIFQSTSVDMVIVDAIMPKMGGREFLVALNQLSPNTPTILLTGSLIAPVEEHNWPVQPTRSIVKGEGARKLLDTIRELTPIPSLISHEA